MLRIVHFSDILAGSQEAADVSAALARKLPGPAHYIVVAGNLTVDGSEDSYGKAHDLLLHYADALLVRDPDGLRRNRVFLVPGQRDIYDWESSEAFRKFHDRFFADEIKAGRVEPFQLHSAIVRELKDLTLVGLSFWTPGPRAALTTDLTLVNDAMREAAHSSRMMSVEYTRRPPTLVVSAASIASAGATAAAEIFTSIQTLLSSDFRKTLHLFGQGGTLVYPHPVSFRHPSLGTGVRTDGAWPFIANVLELRPRVLESKAADGPFLKCEIFQQKTPHSAPEDLHPWLSGDLDAFLKPGAEGGPRREAIFEQLLRTLEDRFRPGSHKYIVIRGFSGAGRNTFYDFMKDRDRLIRRPVHVIDMQLRNYEDFAAAFKKKAEAFLDMNRPDLMPILVVHDLCLGTLRQNQFEALKNLFDENDPCSVMDELGGVVLLLPAIDITLGAARDSNTETIALTPPGRATELVEEFGCRVPMEEDRLLRLTDGYTGFTELILKTATKRFSGNSGAEPVTRAKISSLLDEVLDAPEVDDEAFYHRQGYAARNTGSEVCQDILAKVNEAIDNARRIGQGYASLSDIPPIYVDVDELRARSSSPHQVVDDLEALHDLGVLGRMPGGRTYRVRVLAPFLPKKARATVSRWPEVTEEDQDGPADVLIVTALAEEREAVLKKLPNARRLDPSEEDVRTYYLSKLPLSRAGAEGAFYRVVVTDLVGMAQVNAALAANDAIRRWKPRALLLVGIAGGVEASGVALGDVLIAREVAYFGIGKATEAGMEYEVKMIPADPRMVTAMNNFARADGSALITVPRPDEGIETMHFGPMATGDTVVADAALLKRYQGTTRKLIGVEMEAWGVAMAAFQASHPKRFFMIRAASDLADSRKDNAEVRRWREYACDVAASYAIGFLRSGPLPLPPAPNANRVQGAFTGGANALY